MHPIKRSILGCVIVGTLGWMVLDSAYFSPTAPVESVQKTFTPSPAPSVTFPKLNGGEIALDTLKGNTVLLNFWASWCVPCRVEFPTLLRRVAKDKTTVLVAVTADANADDAKEFLAPLQKEFADVFATGRVVIAHDPMGKISSTAFQIHQYPETIIIGPDGTMREKIVGVMRE